ncbi:hypothetical protein [Massilia sp. TS11]|uniref:hypothetical protein n=1 Tax=Massilia sp. TS11 TaxID=2908003 RepID=UPI001EDAFA62|nr:hypothetical protein [Massilia sp. TS11]MCG2584306.1 hypothetical protein [Massilia sp. TS11]
MKSLVHRLYSHYLMPSRLPLYAELLTQARKHGYQLLTVKAAAALQPDALPERMMVLRHDIDSDLDTARAWFREEQRQDVRATYYFRLSTLDRGLMRDLADYGSEVGYHYEEVASFAKRERLRRPEQVQANLERMGAAFEQHLGQVEHLAGCKVHTVASHGDFANRKLGISNTVLLADAALRQRCGIACEAYDASFLARFDCYISDKPAPVYFHPLSPFAAMGRHARICLLTHPVQWRVNWAENLRLDVGRVMEGLQW